MSERISSVSVTSKVSTRAFTIGLEYLKGGGGLPLRKLARHQVVFLMNLLPFSDYLRASMIGSTTPYPSTFSSLTSAVSPAMLP